MVYQYKQNSRYPVPAQVAGEELERIYQAKGELQAKDVVDASRPQDAPLHPCFEWEDPVAAELYRQQQARNLIGAVVTIQETASSTPVEVRAYLHVDDSYHPTNVVISDQDMRQELLHTFLKEAEAFQRRLETFSALRPAKQLKRAVDRTVQQIRENSSISR